MAKYRMLVLAIALSAASIITPTVQGKTGTSAQRSQGRIDFVGEVIKMDPAARSMTLRSGGITVSFDISNPVLQGYGSVTAIRKGDRVGAGYTADGIHITKLSKIAEKGGAERTASTTVETPKKQLRIARRIRTDGTSFTDVDNNKDGKISPVELSVIVPGLTIEQFRQYDKNHDGYLDKAEFEQIKLP
jgi:hypothetical protein